MGLEKLFKEIIRPMTDDEKKNCDGYKLSNCCGAPIVNGICTDCNEHTTNECSTCLIKDCPNLSNQ